MKIGNKQLEQVYFLATEVTPFEEEYKTEEDLIRRIEALRMSNMKLTSSCFYGDISYENGKLRYTNYELLPVKEDLDSDYADTKNMTELKRKYKDQVKAKDFKVVTFEDGLIKSVSKKSPARRVLLVEELQEMNVEENVETASFLKDKSNQDSITKYNSLPDAKNVYKKDYFATNYDDNLILYTLTKYRVLYRALTLEEMDKKLESIQNEYTLRRIYGIKDSSKVSIVRLPEFKMSDVFYQEDRLYLDPKKLVEIYEKRSSDLTLMHELIDDKYTNLKGTLATGDLEARDKENRQEKVTRLKRTLKSEVTLYEVLQEKEPYPDKSRDLEMQRYDIERIVHALVYNLVYKDFKKHTTNYSVMRHLASLVKRRDDKLNEMSEEYWDSLIKSYEELEKGMYEETTFHIL